MYLLTCATELQFSPQMQAFFGVRFNVRRVPLRSCMIRINLYGNLYVFTVHQGAAPPKKCGSSARLPEHF